MTARWENTSPADHQQARRHDDTPPTPLLAGLRRWLRRAVGR